jgi:hypothetical protein
VVISHSPRLRERADRAVSIEDGRIVRETSVEGEAEVRPARSLLRTVADRLLPAKEPPRAPAEPPRRVPVPVDPALPRLPVLLDPNAIAPYLERSLGSAATAPDVRIRFLRYKPGTNIVVRYDVDLDGRRHSAIAMIKAGRSLARRAEKPENVALARLVDGRSPAPMPLHYEPEIDALIQWFPLDLDLPTLAEPPGRLLEELDAAGVWLGAVDDGPATLAYKPRRRAVLRIGEHVLKFYAEQAPFERAAAGLRVAGRVRGVRTPALEGHLRARLVTVQPALSGSRPSRAADVALEAGQLLCQLHEPRKPFHDLDAERYAGLRAAPPLHQLVAAARSSELVTAMLPALSGRVQALLRELEATMPTVDRFVHSHGDFNARQLLVTLDGVAVVDFDSACLAPAALDVADYAAHEVRGTEDDVAKISGLLDDVVEGYGERPSGLAWYLATSIIRRSPEPFRYVEEQWPERIEGMVGAAERVLRR